MGIMLIYFIRPFWNNILTFSSSTIISDILSRILNETVMHEENVCRICFNLLNDVDYHLKVLLTLNALHEDFILGHI